MTEPKWLTIARGEIGVTEIEGPKSNSRIVEYAKVAIGVEAPDSEAWCAKFVGWVFAKDGLDETTGTRKANARSYLDWGEKLDKPALGCVVVFWRVSPKSWQGHVGFYIRSDSTHVWVLGGNQGNKVSIAKYPKSQVLGYRWPKKATPPAAPDTVDRVLQRVQTRLKELGYFEVGSADGKWGSKTRGACAAFMADWNERNPDEPLTIPSGTGKQDYVTDDLLVAMAKALPRSISPARETAEENKIGDYAAIADAKKVGVIAKIGGVASAILAGNEITGASEKISGIKDTVNAAQDLLGTVIQFVGPMWPFLLLAAAIAVIWWARKIRKEEIESYRMGETP